MRNIQFFTEDCDFTLRNKGLIRQWILQILQQEGFKPGALQFIFCSDAYLIEINKQYLQHDTYTDIVTFPYEDRDNRISGDLFISIERVFENAKSFQVTEVDELHRVMIHGVLHLCGYKDKTKSEQKVMRTKENDALASREEKLTM
jgi:probable rRNA maturation factor